MQRKGYIVDNGYLQSFYLTNNWGKLLENAVAVFLYRLYNELHYFRGNNEIDFVLPDNKPIEICFDFENSSEREVDAILKYMNYMDIDKGFILTWEKYDEFEKNNREIKIVPVYYFMLFPELYITINK